VSVVTTGAAGAVGDKNVGTNKAVTVSGLTLTGADAFNYTISGATGVTATITPKAITASGITANNKVYDTTTTATLNLGGATLTREAPGAGTATDNLAYTGDTLTIVTGAAVGNFSNKNAGTGKAVTVTGLSLSGADAGNYTITDASGATANITPKPITATGLDALDKTYDATRAATLTGTAALTGGATGAADNKFYTGDAVTVSAAGAVGLFDTKNVGTNKPVTITGLTLSGDDAANYTVTDASNARADIAPKVLTLTGLTAEDKFFDGNTAAKIIGTVGLSGVIAGDTTNPAGSVTAGTFANPDIGQDKDVAANLASLSLTGADAGNYVIAPLVLKADINSNIQPPVVPTVPDAPPGVTPAQTSGTQPAVGTGGAEGGGIIAVAGSGGTTPLSFSATGGLSFASGAGGNSVTVAPTPTGGVAITLPTNANLEPIDQPAMPVFRSSTATGGGSINLDFRISVQGSGNQLNVNRVATGTVNNTPDTTRTPAAVIQVRIEGTGDGTPTFSVASINGTMVIRPVNQEAVRLLTANPNLVIGASLVRGKNEAAAAFAQINAVVLTPAN